MAATRPADGCGPSSVDGELGRLQKNWHGMSGCFGVVHGCAVLQTAYATSVLEGTTGYYSTAITYSMWLVSGLLLSSTVVSHLGPKNALVLALYAMTLSFMMFAAAVGIQSTSLAYAGSVITGLAAGILWSAQGVFFARVVETLACYRMDGGISPASGLAASFAAWNFAFEVVLKVLVVAFQEFQVSNWLPLSVCCAFSLAASTLMALTVEAPATEASGGLGKIESSSLSDVVALWRDPNLWLLSFTNLTFSFSAAFVVGKVNGEVVRNVFGLGAVGLLMIAVSVIAALMQWPYRILADQWGSGAGILVGSAGLMAVPCCYFAFQHSGLKIALVAAYFAQGVGRGAYEATNRTIFAEFFPPPRDVVAFANMTAQQAVSFSTAMLLSLAIGRDALAYIIIALAAATMPCYMLAASRHKHTRSTMGEAFEEQEIATARCPVDAGWVDAAIAFQPSADVAR